MTQIEHDPRMGFPRRVPAPSRGGVPLFWILAGIVGVGLAVTLIVMVLRVQDARERERYQAAVDAPGKHAVAVTLSLGDALQAVLGPHCPDRACGRIEFSGGGSQAWQVVAAPAGLRMRLHAYLDPIRRVRVTRVTADLATQRDDGDLAKAYPAMLPILNAVLRAASFPDDFRDGSCAGTITAGSRRFSCEAAAYDPITGGFDLQQQPAARFYRSNRVLMMVMEDSTQ